MWTVSPPDGFENAVTWQTNGNFMELSISDCGEIVGDSILLTVSDADGEYTPTMFSVEVTDAYG